MSGVAEEVADDGLFGPASLTWRVSADLASPVAGLRSLLMQALYQLTMAGVDQHSGWRRAPVGRLAATSAYLATVTFGERAVQAAARVRRIHDHVRGTDPVTGRPYAAGDPALLLWVHVALVQSSLAAGWAFGTPLPAQDGERKQRRHDPLSEGSVTMSRRSSVSRRRENRTYGLKGGWGNGPLAAPRP